MCKINNKMEIEWSIPSMRLLVAKVLGLKNGFGEQANN
jgi:hypothetical protein